MRTAFSFGLLLLGLVLALNLVAGTYDRLVPQDPEQPGVTNGTGLRVFSCGGGLPPERFRNRRHWEGVFVNGQMYSRINVESGLRVTAVAPDGSVEFRNFRLDALDEDAADLDRLVRTLPVDTVLAAGVMRTAMPAGEGAGERKELLEGTFAVLGAEAPPLERRNVSWAYIGIRRPGGWLRLAEKRSTVKGVVLSRNLPADRAHFDDEGPGVLTVDTTMKRYLLDVPEALTLDAFARTNPEFPVRRVAMRAIEATPPFGPRAAGLETRSSRVRWPFLRVPPGALLQVFAGHRTDPGHHCQGVSYEIRIDDRVVAEREIPFEPNFWHPWSVDLSPWSGRWIALELRVTPLDQEDWSLRPWGEPAVWGEPRLLYEADARDDGSPPSLQDDLDRDGNGLLTPAEVSGAIARLDADGDGFLSLEEVPEGYRGSLSSADADGDARASASELEAWVAGLFAL